MGILATFVTDRSFSGVCIYQTGSGTQSIENEPRIQLIALRLTRRRTVVEPSVAGAQPLDEIDRTLGESRFSGRKKISVEAIFTLESVSAVVFRKSYT